MATKPLLFVAAVCLLCSACSAQPVVYEFRFDDVSATTNFLWYSLCSGLRILHPGADEVDCAVSHIHGELPPRLKAAIVPIFKNHVHIHADRVFNVSIASDTEPGYLERLQHATEFLRLDAAQRLVLAQHFRYWHVVQDCCAHSHKTSFRDVSYPACEMYNMDEVERLLLESQLGARHPTAIYTSVIHPDVVFRPGTCPKSASPPPLPAAAPIEATIPPPSQPRILAQYGRPRTASTFQWYALCTIARVLYPSPSSVECFPTIPMIAGALSGRADAKQAYVFKNHGAKTLELPRGKYELFTSSVPPPEFPRPLHVQHYDKFVAEGWEKELAVYADIFSLTPTQQQLVYQHLRYWDIIRVCCGSQQSVDSRAKLHNDTHRKHPFLSYDYPACEIYHLDVVEALFLQSDIAQAHPDDLRPSFSSVLTPHAIEHIKPGFCQASNAKIRSGFDFNGKKWEPRTNSKSKRNIV